MQETIRIPAGNTRFVAHRGLSGLEKENTSQAFVAAGNRASYWGIETDVHRTSDGQFIIIHDSDTRRLVGNDPSLVVEQTDFETLRSLCLLDTDNATPRNDLRMPSLAEYVRVCKKYGKHAVLELKNGMTADTVAGILDVLRLEEWLDRTTIIGFDFETILHARKLLPDQPIQYLCGELTPEVIDRLRRYHLDLDIRYPALTADAVRSLHADGIEINCWTVDDPVAGARLVEWGVDYITSNILEPLPQI